MFTPEFLNITPKIAVGRNMLPLGQNSLIDDPWRDYAGCEVPYYFRNSARQICEILTFSPANRKQYWMTLTLATPPKSCEYLSDPFALYPYTHVSSNTPGSPGRLRRPYGRLNCLGRLVQQNKPDLRDSVGCADRLDVPSRRPYMYFFSSIACHWLT